MTSPIVIGHRGASGYLPEHTLAAYELAAEQGADFIEPDLVMTKDGVLVARHENGIGSTTDVSTRPEFANRRTTKTVDGVVHTDWFVEDFTIAELKTLRAHERLPAVRPHNTSYNGRFEIPTFIEILQLREQLSHLHGREIGVYPEIKHPTYFRRRGLDSARATVDALNTFKLNQATSAAFVQCFELSTLYRLIDELSLTTRVVFLLQASGHPADHKDTDPPYADYLTTDHFNELKQRGVSALGPDRELVLKPVSNSPHNFRDTGLVDRAHDVGLAIHIWTFRAENAFLPSAFQSFPGRDNDPALYGKLAEWIQLHLKTGIDGLFSDHPDIARTSVDTFTE